MITLHAFGPMFNLPDASPFVLKAMLLLKFAGLPYQTAETGLRGAPKGKLPFIEDDGAIIADSTFIRFHIEKKYGFDFDAGYDDEQKATAWAVEKMCEDHLYWAVLAARWLDDANFAKGPALFFDSLPLPLRLILPGMVRRAVRKSLYAQGLGRHREDEIERLAIRDIEALAILLGDKEFLLGAKPCAADASVMAAVSHILPPMFDTKLRTAAEGYANLLAYRDRMMRLYFPDVSAG
jgi:glutathione S-transferase